MSSRRPPPGVEEGARGEEIQPADEGAAQREGPVLPRKYRPLSSISGDAGPLSGWPYEERFFAESPASGTEAQERGAGQRQEGASVLGGSAVVLTSVAAVRSFGDQPLHEPQPRPQQFLALEPLDRGAQQ